MTLTRPQAAHSRERGKLSTAIYFHDYYFCTRRSKAGGRRKKITAEIQTPNSEMGGGHVLITSSAAWLRGGDQSFP